MRAGEQIATFGAAVDKVLAEMRPRLPADLVIARTSDQPQQVVENIDLFMDALYEAIALVVIVALLGLLGVARRGADDARDPDHAAR